jgi:hypothetical protein
MSADGSLSRMQVKYLPDRPVADFEFPLQKIWHIEKERKGEIPVKPESYTR